MLEMRAPSVTVLLPSFAPDLAILFQHAAVPVSTQILKCSVNLLYLPPGSLIYKLSTSSTYAHFIFI